MKNLLFHLKAVKTDTLFPKSHEKSTFSFKSCENRYPQSFSWSGSRNFLKTAAGAGAKTNSFGSATLVIEL
jgi:hypothetical protein